jgi:hypothetical protein
MGFLSSSSFMYNSLHHFADVNKMVCYANAAARIIAIVSSGFDVGVGFIVAIARSTFRVEVFIVAPLSYQR